MNLEDKAKNFKTKDEDEEKCTQWSLKTPRLHWRRNNFYCWLQFVLFCTATLFDFMFDSTILLLYQWIEFRQCVSTLTSSSWTSCSLAASLMTRRLSWRVLSATWSFSFSTVSRNSSRPTDQQHPHQSLISKHTTANCTVRVPVDLLQLTTDCVCVNGSHIEIHSCKLDNVAQFQTL